MNFPPHTIRSLQDPFEFTQLVLLYTHFWPRNVLEIGTANGGTVWAWAHNGPRGVRVIAVSMFDDTSHKDPRPLFPEWEKESESKIIAIDGDSHSPEVISQLKALAPFDWIYIDGDHRKDAVRADYETCLSLAAHPSVIVLHDIAFEEQEALAVKPLWEELSKIHSTTRIVTTPGQLGVGLIFLK